METTLSKEQFLRLCIKIGTKLSLMGKGIHVAAIFENNKCDTLIGWAVLDSDNNVIKTYDNIEDLFNDYK